MEAVGFQKCGSVVVWSRGGTERGPWSCLQKPTQPAGREVLPVGHLGHAPPGTNLVDISEMRLRRKMEKKANVRSALEKRLIWFLLNV